MERGRGRSFRFLSKLRAQCGRARSIPEFRQRVHHSSGQELVFGLVVRDDLCLDLPPIWSLAERLNRREDQEPSGLPGPLSESCGFLFEHWEAEEGGLPRPLMSTRLWRSFDREFHTGHRCLNCLPHCSRNLRQSW